MSASFKTLKTSVLQLPERERAELAHDLITSLDGPADESVEEAWDAEIRRRLGEIDSGTAKLIDRDEFSRRLRARFKR